MDTQEYSEFVFISDLRGIDIASLLKRHDELAYIVELMHRDGTNHTFHAALGWAADFWLVKLQKHTPCIVWGG